MTEPSAGKRAVNMVNISRKWKMILVPRTKPDNKVVFFKLKSTIVYGYSFG